MNLKTGLAGAGGREPVVGVGRVGVAPGPDAQAQAAGGGGVGVEQERVQLPRHAPRLELRPREPAGKGCVYIIKYCI